MENIEIEKEPELKFRRDLKLLDAVMISVGAMTGASIYILAGVAIGWAGPAILIALILSFLVTMLTAMAYAELTSAFPEAGGGYLWVHESLPRPFGFMSGWNSWFGHAIACSFYSATFSTATVWFFQAYGLFSGQVTNGYFKPLLTLTIILIFLVVNLLGTGITGKTQTIITSVQLAALAVFFIFGAITVFMHPNITPKFSPFFTDTGWVGMIVAMGILFIAFEGYEIAAQTAEELENSEKNLPKAIFMSVAITTLLYILIFLVSISASPGWKYVASTGTFAVIDVGGIVMPNYGKGLLLLALLVGTVATLNATIFSSSRVSFAMGRDGVLPKIFAKIHPVHRTPYVSIIASGVIIIIIALFLPLTAIAATADIMFLILFLLVNVALIVLRYRMPNIKRAYLVPLFPLIPILGILSKAILMSFLYLFSPLSWYITIAWTEVGLLLYYFSIGKKEIEVAKPEEIAFRPAVEKKVKKIILVPVTENAERLVSIATIIAKERERDITLFKVIEVSSGAIRKSITFSETEAHTRLLEHLSKISKKEVSTHISATVSSNSGNAIVEEAVAQNAEMIVMGWRKFWGLRVFGKTLDTVYKNTPCSLVIVKDLGMKDYFSTVTVLFGERWSTRLAARIGVYIAKSYGSLLKIIHIASNIEDLKAAEEDLNEIISLCKEQSVEPQVTTKVAKDVGFEVIRESNETDLMIFDVPFFEELTRPGKKVTSQKFILSLNCGVILVKRLQEIERKEDYTYSLYHHG